MSTINQVSEMIDFPPLLGIAASMQEHFADLLEMLRRHDDRFALVKHSWFDDPTPIRPRLRGTTVPVMSIVCPGDHDGVRLLIQSWHGGRDYQLYLYSDIEEEPYFLVDVDLQAKMRAIRSVTNFRHYDPEVG